MVPNFLIIGAQRSGTTTLHHCLRQHPDIFCSDVQKELNFFSNMPYNHSRIEDYHKFFEGWRGEHAVGEASVNYLYYSHVPELIAQKLPDVKLIAILRNPIARAYSHYRYCLKKGIEWMSFEAALEQEEKRVQALWKSRRREVWYYSYKDIGRYSVQLRRYLQYFQRDKFHILLFEDFVRSPEKELEKVCRFLGVDTSFAFETVETGTDESNHAQCPRYLYLQRLLAYLAVHGSRRRVVWRVSKASKKLIPLMPLSNEFPPMKQETRRALGNFFRPYIEDLSNLFDLELSRWTQPA